MKKLFTFCAALFVAAMAQAGIGLSVNGNAISRDTTITVTEVNIDEFTDEAEMTWEGIAFYGGQLTVYIEREHAAVEDHEDQLCAGACTTGTAGQLRDTMNFDMSMYMPPVQVYAHYYPQSLNGSETIKYRFVGGGDDFTLTVVYDPRQPQAIDNVNSTNKATKVLRDGQVIIRSGKTEYNVNGAQL